MTGETKNKHYLDMVGVRGSIPLAPTISRPEICPYQSIGCCCFSCVEARVMRDLKQANLRERKQNTAHKDVRQTCAVFLKGSDDS